MKNLYFLLISLFITAAVSAQAPSARALRVENLTSCTIYFSISGSEHCPCDALPYTSTMIAIGPASSAFYPNSTFIPGFPPVILKGIVRATVFHGPMMCTPNFGIVGQTPCGIPPTYSFTALSLLCSNCEDVHAQWVSSTSCEDLATLRFTTI